MMITIVTVMGQAMSKRMLENLALYFYDMSFQTLLVSVTVRKKNM